MTDERAVVATCPIAHRSEHDREHDWAALERFADLATRSGLAVSADDFMWMGAAEFEDGRTVHSYKHVSTRDIAASMTKAAGDTAADGYSSSMFEACRSPVHQ